MNPLKSLPLLLCSLLGCPCSQGTEAPRYPTPANTRVQAARQAAATTFHEAVGKPVFLRIIKENRLLELWGKGEDGWHILKSYPVAGMSGDLGPKEEEGDEQAPEGFYAVTRDALNPNSRYHLSFNIGYPNLYDRQLGRTGSWIMIHGSDVSIGCFAMTDPGIEEIYGMVEAALLQGQPSVPVQIYPFPMTEERMQEEQDGAFFPFWEHLRPGWLHTEQYREPYPSGDSKL